MTAEKKTKWNKAYKETDFAQARPADVLSDNAFLLPEGGSALDLACGQAGNALFLARMKSNRFHVDAIDFSEAVITALNKYSEDEDLAITGIIRDIEKQGLYDGVAPKKQYDVIVVSHFLNRSLMPQIILSLKPNGLLFYQTWSQEKVDNMGPKNADFRLERGELLTLCSDLVPLSYRENGRSGDLEKGLRNKAFIVARKDTAQNR